MRILKQNMDGIGSLYNKHKVAKLFAFGSVHSDRFKKNSDKDFLVDFADVDLYDYADNYFDFKDSLSHLLKHEIDLLEDKAIRNPILRNSIDSF